MKTILNGLTQEQLKELVIYDPITGNFISKVNRGKRTKVGDILGSVNAMGYVYMSLDNKQYKAHRLAFLYMKGYVPKVIDHIDTVKRNNSWNNLREATNAQNGHNSLIPINNTTGVKGLRYHSQCKSYEANISKDGKRYFKSFSCRAWGKDKAKELAIQWLQTTRETLHREYANHG